GGRGRRKRTKRKDGGGERRGGGWDGVDRTPDVSVEFEIVEKPRHLSQALFGGARNRALPSGRPRKRVFDFNLRAGRGSRRQTESLFGYAKATCRIEVARSDSPGQVLSSRG